MSLISAKSALLNQIFLTKEFNLLRQSKNNLFANKNLYDEVMNLCRNKLSDSPREFNEEELQKLMQYPEAAEYIRACINMEQLVFSILSDINSAIHINLR